MSKKLVKHGNSLALVIEKPLLNMLKIDENTQVEMIIEECALVVRAIPRDPSKKRKEEIDEIADRVMERYDEVFRKLSKS